jgi:phage shock protein PspC (stress-responsive transcriptional regulator)
MYREKKLYKSSSDRVLFGVCGGIAEYFEIDAVIVRLLVVIFTLTAAAGLIFYIIAAIIMKRDDSLAGAYEGAAGGQAADGYGGAESYNEAYGPPGGDIPQAPAFRRAARQQRGSGVLIVGLLFIIIGLLYLINHFLPIFQWVRPGMVAALVLVMLGIYFVAKR